MFIQEHNCETGEITQRELSVEEINKAKSESELKKSNAQAQAAAKVALLERLGITEEEAKLLLG